MKCAIKGNSKCDFHHGRCITAPSSLGQGWDKLGIQESQKEKRRLCIGF